MYETIKVKKWEYNLGKDIINFINWFFKVFSKLWKKMKSLINIFKWITTNQMLHGNLCTFPIPTE